MTSKVKVRAGIVGSGFAANLHYEGLARVYGTDVDLVGIFSPTETNARRFAAARGLRSFPSLSALLDEGEGVHAIVEKPLTGWFGDGSPDFVASTTSMQGALDGALASIDRMLEAEAKSR